MIFSRGSSIGICSRLHVALSRTPSMLKAKHLDQHRLKCLTNTVGSPVARDPHGVLLQGPEASESGTTQKQKIYLATSIFDHARQAPKCQCLIIFGGLNYAKGSSGFDDETIKLSVSKARHFNMKSKKNLLHRNQCFLFSTSLNGSTPFPSLIM